MAMKELPLSTVNLLASTQVITSVSTVVKELVENSLDAGATNIDVKLENYGMDRIEVKDDGCGIAKANASNMCRQNYTSKIYEFSDIDKLQSYGFRGEALSSICRIAKVTVTTKTESDKLATTYFINSNGDITSMKPSHVGNGTSITVNGLFHNVPVRKQYLKNSSRAKEDLKETENIVKSLAIINHGLRLTFYHNKCLLWQKPSCSTLRQSVMQIIGLSVVKDLEEVISEEEELGIYMLVPKREAKHPEIFCTTNNFMIYINKRPVQYKKLEKGIMKCIAEHFVGRLPDHRHLHCLLSVVVLPGDLDINLEPNKTKVMLKNEDEILSKIESLLHSYYGIAEDEVQIINESSTEKSHTEINMEDDLDMSGNEEQSGNKCKRLKVDTEISQPTAPSSTTVVMTSDKDVHQNKIGNERRTNVQVMESVSVDALQTPYDSIFQSSSNESLFLNTQELVKNDETISFVYSSSDVSGAGTEEVNIMQTDSNSTHTDNYSEHSTMGQVHNQNSGVGNTISVNYLVTKLLSGLGEGGVEDLSHTTGENLIIDSGNNTSSSTTLEEKIPECGRTILEESDSVADLNSNVVEMLENVPVECKETATPSLMMWSKGQVQAPNGKVMKSTLLFKPRTPIVPMPDDLDSSCRSVSSQMDQSVQCAFLKFARRESSKIIEKLPQLPFTKVAELLVENWRRLPPEDKQRYEEMVEEVRKKCNPTEKPVQHGSKAPCMRKFSIKKYLSNAKSHAKTSKRFRTEEIICLSFDELKEQCASSSQELRCENSGPSLIGQLTPSGKWIYRNGDELGIVRHWGLQEAVLYHRLMCDHAIPLQKLDSCITFDENTLGADLWKVLLSLGSTYDVITNKITITNDVITKNGFKIELLEGSGETSCMITDIGILNYYEIPDLKDILKLVQENGSNSLEKCRPQRVICYIKSEAVRIVRHCPDKMGRSTLEDLIRYWNSNLQHLGKVCLHGRPFFCPLTNLSGRN